jgi:hypothetical protein
VRRGFFPLDRRLRLRRDSWSEGLVRACARLGTTQPSFEIAAQTLSGFTGVWISDSTVWRHHQEVTDKIEKQLLAEEERTPCWPAELEEGAKAWIPAREPIVEHGSVSIDGLTVLVREEGYREVKMVAVSDAVLLSPEQSKAAEGAVARQEKVLASGGMTNGDEPDEEMRDSAERKKAGAALTEEVHGRQDGLKLMHHSYRAVLGDKETFRSALAGELTRRRVDDARKLTTVNDGAEWIWDLVQSYLSAKRVEVLDWSHAVQNLAKASNAAWGEGSQEAKEWLAQRKTELWNGQLFEVRVALAALPRRRKERGKAIRQVQGYFVEHAKRLEYARFRAEGRPIGSGSVESGGKNVVAWRMKRGGQSWSRPAATRMLAALGEVHSGRWDEDCKRLAKAA